MDQLFNMRKNRCPFFFFKTKCYNLILIDFNFYFLSFFLFSFYVISILVCLVFEECLQVFFKIDYGLLDPENPDLIF